VTLGVDKLQKGLLKGHYKFGKRIAPFLGVHYNVCASGIGKRNGNGANGGMIELGKTVGAVLYDFMPKTRLEVGRDLLLC